MPEVEDAADEEAALAAVLVPVPVVAPVVTALAALPVVVDPPLVPQAFVGRVAGVYVLELAASAELQATFEAFSNSGVAVSHA